MTKSLLTALKVTQNYTTNEYDYNQLICQNENTYKPTKIGFMDNKEIDYKRAAEQLRKGEPLFGKDGALAPMLERILLAKRLQKHS